MATTQPSKTTARAGNLKPLPPGVIPSPRRQDPSESLPADRLPRRNVFVAGIAVVAAAGAALTVLLNPSAQTTRAPAPAATVQRSAADGGFLTTVHEQVAFAATDDDSLIKTGHLLCDQLRSGANPDQIGLASTGNPYTVEDVSTAIGAAVGAYCPDQMAHLGANG